MTFAHRGACCCNYVIIVLVCDCLVQTNFFTIFVGQFSFIVIFLWNFMR